MRSLQTTFESGGRTIRIDCFVPDGTGPFPAIISLHGSGGNYAGISEPAAVLANRGYGVYVLHYFDRTGTITADKQAIFKNFPVWMKTLWDAVSHVARLAEVDAQHIALLGFSLGAYLSLSDAAIDSRICAVVDFFGGLPKEMKLFTRRLCPVLILHGEKDMTVPVEEAYHLQQLLEKKNIPYEMKIYPGAGHGFSGEVWLDALQRVLGFLRKHVAADPK